MASYEHELSSPPSNARSRELWVQHAAGFILFEDSRAYAVQQIDPALTSEARAAVLEGIDHALYGLMMIIDGVSGTLANARNQVQLAMIVRHLARDASGETRVVSELDLADGDGMCMGFHGWRENDFGEHRPVASSRKKRAPTKVPPRKPARRKARAKRKRRT
jgi:hypothetical protein